MLSSGYGGMPLGSFPRLDIEAEKGFNMAIIYRRSPLGWKASGDRGG
jgi:hypothetical protein